MSPRLRSIRTSRFMTFLLVLISCSYNKEKSNNSRLDQNSVRQNNLEQKLVSNLDSNLINFSIIDSLRDDYRTDTIAFCSKICQKPNDALSYIVDKNIEKLETLINKDLTYQIFGKNDSSRVYLRSFNFKTALSAKYLFDEITEGFDGLRITVKEPNFLFLDSLTLYVFYVNSESKREKLFELKHFMETKTNKKIFSVK